MVVSWSGSVQCEKNWQPDLDTVEHSDSLFVRCDGDMDVIATDELFECGKTETVRRSPRSGESA